MRLRRFLLLLPFLVVVALPLLPIAFGQEVTGGDVTVATTEGPVTLPSPTQLDFAAYLVTLGAFMLPTYAVTAALASKFRIDKERLALLTGTVIALLAHASRFEGCIAPGGPIFGWVWAFIGGVCVTGGGTIMLSNRVVNPLTPKGVDASFSGTGDGKNGIVKSLLVPLLLVGLVSSACVPMHDARTLADINAMKSKSEAATLCGPALARETSKTGDAYDSKTVRHLKELCDCYERAADSIQEAACKANVGAYAAYEEAKR